MLRFAFSSLIAHPYFRELATSRAIGIKKGNDDVCLVDTECCRQFVQCQLCTAIATHSDPKVTLSQEAVTPSAQPLFKAWLLERAIQSIRCSRASRHYGRLQVPDAGLIRERLEADCTPYAVHGDGVQVSSVSQYGSTGVPAQ